MAATVTSIRTRGIVRVEDAKTDLGAAMFDAVAVFATEAGLAHMTDNDIEAAAREPVSMAAAYRDLCEALGVPVPRFVQRALN